MDVWTGLEAEKRWKCFLRFFPGESKPKLLLHASDELLQEVSSTVEDESLESSVFKKAISEVNAHYTNIKYSQAHQTSYYIMKGNTDGIYTQCTKGRQPFSHCGPV